MMLRNVCVASSTQRGTYRSVAEKQGQRERKIGKENRAARTECRAVVLALDCLAPRLLKIGRQDYVSAGGEAMSATIEDGNG